MLNPNPRAPPVEVRASPVGAVVEPQPVKPLFSFSAVHGFLLVSTLTE